MNKTFYKKQKLCRINIFGELEIWDCTYSYMKGECPLYTYNDSDMIKEFLDSLDMKVM